MTRQALTMFSTGSDVAKYFVILPALFLVAYPKLNVLNVMNLASPKSAVLSALIFNAIMMMALIPLALHGVRFASATTGTPHLRGNLLVYGAAGLMAPFVGIKVIDLAITGLGLV